VATQVILHPLILVTGSREAAYEPVVKVLDSTVREFESWLPARPFLVHGHNPRGADHYADVWGHRAVAARRLLWVERFPANWTVFKQGAGPSRNAAMAERIWAHQQAGGFVVVLAFPLGTSPGTRNMIEACEKAGINDIRIYEQET
jgi:hypothetical protein